MLLLTVATTSAQLDPFRRNLIQLGYDQALEGQGPQAIYAYYYYNNPEVFGSNTVLRTAVAPLYLDGELGFKHLLSPSTDLGLGFYGGAYADNYYYVNQGDYNKSQSFNGNSGGAAISLYQRLNPGQLVPVNLVARAGARYTVYARARDTSDFYDLPENQPITFIRAGLRLAGREPVLDPALGLELSLWYSHQWRSHPTPYGYGDTRELSPSTGLYWAYANFNYTWTNIHHRIAFSMTAGGSDGADPLNAWRLGGVLPLVAEFPLMLPGYYYEELTAQSFLDFYSAYLFPLDPAGRWQLRFEAGAARVNYIPGFEQPTAWQSGVGIGLAFTPPDRAFHIVVRYGYGFQAERDGSLGAQSIGLLFQYDFEHRSRLSHAQP